MNKCIIFYKHCVAAINRLKYLIKYIHGVKSADVVLVDTPTHENLGDHAIVLAEIQLFREAGLTYYELTSGMIDRMEGIYALFTPKRCMVAVHGGGFLGSIWPKEELRFRRILKSFSNHEVMVFPQTVTFDRSTEETEKFFAESSRYYQEHKKLHLFVRERKSYDFIKKNMPAVDVCLTPDVVMLLNCNHLQEKKNGILFCLRSDIEKALDTEDVQKIKEVTEKHFPNEVIEYTDTELNYCVSQSNREQEVEKKLEQFSRAKVIITDRLHGMIFAAITDTPCIAFSNANGKVKQVFQWIRNNKYIRFVDDVSLLPSELITINISETHCFDREGIRREFSPLIEYIQRRGNIDEK